MGSKGWKELGGYGEGLIMSDTICYGLNGDIIIKVTKETLKFVTENHPDFWDGVRGALEPNVIISDLDRFAHDVVRELNDEDENGGTVVTRMFDDAIAAALENGSQYARLVEGEE